MKKLYLKKQAGFSLVEMLVSISILLLVVTGPMTVTSRTSKSATFATEQVQAFFLAQEGLEIAQKLRDDILLANIASPGVAWTNFTNTTGTYTFCYSLTGCGLEWALNDTLATPADCSLTSGCKLRRDTRINPGRSLYTYTISANSEITPFSRKIYLTSTVDGRGVRVRSVVSWRTGSLVAEQKVEVETYLYNIYGS